MSQETHLSKRLAALSPKVAVPFRQLLAAGQLEDDALQTILDAGDLAGDTQRLVGFAVGYLHLRAQGVPVHDVIRMARNQKRRIRLDWSAKRWKAEHDRLSRAEVLARLAAENVTYDVSEFETLLPEQFDGYLIRSSRRLGMEGLRQRHCIASYHCRIHDGRCAIASVIVDGKRWTVELVPTGKPDAPLRIAQIKTRFNGPPSADVQNRIHEMLGIEPPGPPGTPGTLIPAAERSYMDTLRCLFPVLQDHGVRQVTVRFEGYGDSGAIEDIYFDAPDGFDATAITVRHTTTNRQFENGQWITTAEPTESSVHDAIDELTYDYLEETDVDWYNNDGGYGELLIDVLAGTVALDVHVRYTESTCEYSCERDILTGEDQ